MTRRYPYIIPSLLVISAFIIRILLISKGPYHVDCLALVRGAQNLANLNGLPYSHGHGYPLTVMIASVFYALARSCGFDDPITSVNVMSVVFSSLCVIPFFFYIRKLFDQRTALLSSLLLIVNPLFLSVSVYGNSHTVFLFFFFCGLLFLQKYYQDSLPRNLWLFALFFGLAGAARVQDAVLATPALVLAYWLRGPFPDSERPFSKTLGRFLLAGLISLSLILTSYAPLLIVRGLGFFQNAFHSNITNTFEDLPSWFHLHLTWTYLLDTFTWLGILSAAAGCILAWRRNTRATPFLIALAIVPFLFYGNDPITLPRWQTVTIMPFIVFEGYFLARILSTKSWRARTFGLVLLLVLLTFSCIIMAPVLSFRHRQELTVDFARWVGTQTEPTAHIIAGDERLFIDHFAKRATSRQIMTDANYYEDAPAVIQEFKNTLDSLLDQDIPVYITEIGLISNNRGFFKDFLLKHYRLFCVGEHPFEIWHRSCIQQNLINIKLYQIIPQAHEH